MIMRRQIGEVAGMRLPDVDRAHWSAFCWISRHANEDEDADGIRAAASRFGGSVLFQGEGLAFVEFGDPVAAIDFALEPAPEGGVVAAAGIHVGRVKAGEDPIGSHASQVAAAAADLAEFGQTLVTGSVLVELGDAAFDRYTRGSPFSAELDGETMSLYPFAER